MVTTSEYNQCLWIGKDHSEDKVSIGLNHTVYNLATDCNFEFTESYTINYTIKVNDEIYVTLITLDPSIAIAVEG